MFRPIHRSVLSSEATMLPLTLRNNAEPRYFQYLMSTTYKLMKLVFFGWHGKEGLWCRKCFWTPSPAQRRGHRSPSPWWTCPQSGTCTWAAAAPSRGGWVTPGCTSYTPPAWCDWPPSQEWLLPGRRSQRSRRSRGARWTTRTTTCHRIIQEKEVHPNFQQLCST